MATVHTSLGKRIGAEGSYSAGGMFSLKEQHALNQGREWIPDTPIVLNGIQLRLDAANPNSYSGSGSTWLDLSGNGYNATLVNSPIWSRDNSGYFSVNAQSQQTFSVVKPQPSITGQLTTEIWVYFSQFPASGPGYEPTFMHKGIHYTTQLRSTFQGYTFADSSTYSYAAYGTHSIGTALAAGSWRQIVTTKDINNTVRLYINGTLVHTRQSFGGYLVNVDTTLWLIGYSDTDSIPSSVNCLDGRVSVAHVYNRALSDSEVLQNFNAIRGRYGL